MKKQINRSAHVSLTSLRFLDFETVDRSFLKTLASVYDDAEKAGLVLSNSALHITVEICGPAPKVTPLKPLPFPDLDDDDEDFIAECKAKQSKPAATMSQFDRPLDIEDFASHHCRVEEPIVPGRPFELHPYQKKALEAGMQKSTPPAVCRWEVTDAIAARVLENQRAAYGRMWERLKQAYEPRRMDVGFERAGVPQ